MGATTFHRIDQMNIGIQIPMFVNGQEFFLSCDAQVTFPDDPGDMKEPAGVHIARVGIGSVAIKFHDLPADMRAAIEAAAISRAYDIVNDELLSLI